MAFPRAFSMTSNSWYNNGHADADSLTRSFMMGARLGNTTPNVDLNSFNLGGNMLDLNEKMVEVRRRYVHAPKVEIQSRIDYWPQPNQTALALTEQIRVTEIIRTREIFRTKLMQSLCPDEVTQRLNERLKMPAFEDLIYLPYHGSNQLGRNDDGTINLFGSSDRNLLCYHNNGQNETVNQVLNVDPISVYFDETRKEKLGKSPQEFNFLNLTLEPPKPGFVNYLDLFPPIAAKDQDGDGYEEGQDENEVNDWRTHSLPHKKYGPYTCPRCRGVFATSQQFAAHMGSHYKAESRNARNRRRAANSRRKTLHLLHTKYGLAVLPKTFKPSEAKKKWKKSTLWIPEVEGGSEEIKEVVAGENGGAGPERLLDVDVKLQLA